MRVWLINPPLAPRRESQIGAIGRNLFYNSPPLGLAYIAATLEREGHRVTLTDAAIEALTIDELVDRCATVAPDLVGFTATTLHFEQAARAARALARRLDGVPICLGGPHLNARPEVLLDHPEFDFAVLGEGERTTSEVARALEVGDDLDPIPGVVRVREGEIHRAPPRPLIADLDELPLPARHLLPIDRYLPMPNDQRELPKTSVISSRGCPFQCIFCDKGVFGHRFRAFSPGRVVQEMHHLVERYRVRDIAFVDSTFTPTRERLQSVLDAMEADPPRVTWTCSCRANLLDEELLRRMRALGCWRIRIAIESGDDEILARIRKGITREQFADTVHTAARLGFQVKAFFMVGHIGESAASIERTIGFAESLPLADVTVQINTPLRGTPQYEICREHGTLLEGEADQASFFEPVFVPDGMTAEQLVAAQRAFYRRFYLRPEVLWRQLRTVRRPTDITKFLRALPLAANVMLPSRNPS